MKVENGWGKSEDRQHAKTKGLDGNFSCCFIGNYTFCVWMRECVSASPNSLYLTPASTLPQIVFGDSGTVSHSDYSCKFRLFSYPQDVS